MKNTMRKGFLFLALAAIVAGGAFAQRVGDTVQIGGQSYSIDAVSGDTVVLQRVSAANPASEFTFNSSTGTITAYNGQASRVVIPSTINGITVTAISNAFNNRKQVTEVVIPNTVTTIGVRTFSGATNLASVTIGSGVTRIEGWAFDDCFALTSVILPASLTSIAEGAFDTNRSLTSIAEGAFDTNRSLTSVTFLGRINESNFAANRSFPGDLRAKYLAGGPGTYTRPADGNTWTKR